MEMLWVEILRPTNVGDISITFGAAWIYIRISDWMKSLIVLSPQLSDNNKYILGHVIGLRHVTRYLWPHYQRNWAFKCDMNRYANENSETL